MEIIKKIIHFLSNIIYILITLYVIICLPMLFNYKPLVVLSGSMEPTLPTGSVIYYHPVEESDLKVGDIVTFKLKDNKTLVSHRITSINNGIIQTKGDANNSVDSLDLTYSSIMGVDSNIYIPYVGYFIQFVNEHLYLVAIVVTILVLEFLLSNIIDDKKGDIKDEK
ncbi:MAG: signal peptidase I [Bacilli bacterium]|nr:signal peptidase I [Bacilli bacterium]